MDKARNGPFIALIFGTVIVLVLSVMPTMYAGAKNGSFGGGDGTQANPYIIEDVWDLQNMSGNMSAHYVLGNDIDASETRDWNSGAGFRPIGAFNGTLDGENHTITGLCVGHDSSFDRTGLIATMYPGGIVRDVRLADVNVTGDDRVGGLAGSNDLGTIYNCHVTGSVTASGSMAGGLVGANEGTVDRSHFCGRVQAAYMAGGLAGSHFSGIVNNSYFEGTVTSPVAAGGLVTTYFFRGKVVNSHYNIDKVTINGGPNVTIGGVFDAQYQDWISSGLTLDISDYQSTLVPSGEWFEVSSIQGWRDLLGFAGVERLRFRLATDLNLSDAPGLFVPYLAAEFDGANHTVSGLHINSPSTTCTGVFGFSARGTIRNTGVADASVVSCNDAGCLLGRNYFGNVLDSWASGEVVGRTYAGVLVGYNEHGIISRCRSSGSAKADGPNAGGLSGSNDRGSISECRSSASAASRGLVGGLLGASSGTVINCSATGDASGSTSIGGLIGYQLAGRTLTSFATGDVAGHEYVGGLMGRESGEVTDCYALGNVTGTDYVGGLIGEGFSYLTNCYSKGRVSGDIVGGLTGTDHYQVTACFWDKETSGQSTSPEGTGKMTAQMKTLSTFTDSGWDFASMWCMKESVTYPLLRWQDAGRPVADAGDDQVVEVGTTVAFDGTGSTDDLGIPSYTWTFLDGVQVTMDGDRSEHQFDHTGSFVVTLNVTDMSGHWDTDVMNVTVVDDLAPVADAGPDIVVDEGEIVTFNGSGSHDLDGIANYTWTLTDGGPVTLHGVRAEHTFDTPGIFVVTLNVTDATGNWALDTMTVTVRDITPPVAEAGPDLLIDEGTLLIFDGSGCADNVGVVDYTWSFKDVALVELHGMSPQYLFDNPGTFIVSLSVADAAGHGASDSMTVTVRDITPPVADAGGDAVVLLGEPLLLDGSASTDNVGVYSWRWTVHDGDTTVDVEGRTATYTFKNPGTFEVILEVADAAGNSGEARINVTVRETVPPEADAGPDRTVDEDSPVALDGHLSRDNVAITDYTWAFTCGGNEVVLHGVTPSFVFSDPGVYTIRLTVTDPSGNWGADDVVLTVRDVTVPMAEAGPDRTVPVGTTVFLDGQLSIDNGMRFEGCSWTFSYDGRAVSLEFWVAPFTFDIGGVYEVVLTVTDGAGLLDMDTVVITVVDTGRVTGTVLDEEGGPVEGAIVRMTASNGRTYTTMTAANGSFSLEVYHGSFTWMVMKQGYEAISGSSTVAAMDVKELDLSDTPLVREDEKEPPTSSLLMPVVLIVLLVVLGSLILIRKRLVGPKRAA